MGSSLYSWIIATRIVKVIAKEMHKRLITRLIGLNSKCTIMVDIEKKVHNDFIYFIKL